MPVLCSGVRDPSHVIISAVFVRNLVISMTALLLVHVIHLVISIHIYCAAAGPTWIFKV
jgi:hypothetical protein